MNSLILVSALSLGLFGQALRVTSIVLTAILLFCPFLAAQPDLDFPVRSLNAAEKKFLRADLAYLRRIQFPTSSQLLETIVGKHVSGDALRKWTDSKVAQWKYADFDGGDQLIAAYHKDVIFLFPGYFPRSQGFWQKNRLIRLALILHEVRHYDLPSHIPCPSGISSRSGESLEGAMACDDNELGGYGVSVAFLDSVVRSCLGCDEQEVAEARSLIPLLRNRIIMK